jgi:hypothetical protein
VRPALKIAIIAAVTVAVVVWLGAIALSFGLINVAPLLRWLG